MKRFKVFECFAGIGAQNKAMNKLLSNNYLLDKLKIDNTQITYDVVGTSEWFIDAIIGYDLIHHGEQNSFRNYNNLDKQEMLDFISGFVLSKDSKTPYGFDKIEKQSYEDIRQLYIALNRNKNFGSILDLKGQTIVEKTRGVDLLTYSFPCQDISLAGKGAGLEVGTRSGLLWEIKRILEELKDLNKLPKFLLMENVKALLDDKHYDGWKTFEDFLVELGYKNNTFILNSVDFGIPQSRERVFCVSELNGKSNITDIIKTDLNTNLREFLNLDNDLYVDEYKLSIPNNTPSRIDIIENSKKLNDCDYCFTITTKADRKPNPGVFWCDTNGKLIDNLERNWNINGEDITGKSPYRYLTPREALLLMGFSNEDYDIMIRNNINRNTIYMFAGNSIVVNVLEAIFGNILAKYIGKIK